VTRVLQAGRLAVIQPRYRNTFIVSNSASGSGLRGALGVTCTGRHRCSVLRQVSSFKNMCFMYFCVITVLCLFFQLYTAYLLRSPTEGTIQTDKIDSHEPGMKS
jgi:hypothetical protein